MTRPDVLLNRFFARLERSRVDGAAKILERLRADAPESRERSRAETVWARAHERFDDADERLEAHIERWPDDADALHEWGSLLLERQLVEDAAAVWRRVHDLDQASDRAAGVGGPADEARVRRVAETVLRDLPAPFAEQLVSIPVVLAPRPDLDLVSQGFDPRAFGLFEGPDHAAVTSPDAPSMPTRIVLFVNNLVAEFGFEDELAEQIEITLLHEIGHYFGLDEDDLERLGLD